MGAVVPLGKGDCLRGADDVGFLVTFLPLCADLMLLAVDCDLVLTLVVVVAAVGVGGEGSFL